MTGGFRRIVCAALIPAGVRWLRVSQREHYLAEPVLRFATRWWLGSAANVALLVVGFGGALAAAFRPWVGLLTCAVLLISPIGLRLRGKTAKLAWTARLRRLGAATLLLFVLFGAVGAAVAGLQQRLVAEYADLRRQLGLGGC